MWKCVTCQCLVSGGDDEGGDSNDDNQDHDDRRQMEISKYRSVLKTEFLLLPPYQLSSCSLHLSTHRSTQNMSTHTQGHAHADLCTLTYTLTAKVVRV